jgi:hypothetical protein
MGFFAAILSTRVKRLLIMDPCVEKHQSSDPRIQFIAENASYEALSQVLKKHPEITHICCVSVFEHIDPKTREEITRAINDHFQGSNFVTTFEFHGAHAFFDYQLTTRSGSDLVSKLTRFYLDRYESSPTWAENAFDPDPKFRIRDRRFFWQKPRFEASYTPRWYPVALRFLKNPSHAR